VSKKRLGRGLDALLSSDTLASAETLVSTKTSGSDAIGEGSSVPVGIDEVAIDEVVGSRYQPRRAFDEESLGELAASIKAQGLMQPVVVRPRPRPRPWR
jgi:ParB family chromosome partitioning protein